MDDFSTLKCNLEIFLEKCIQEKKEKTTKGSKPSTINGIFKGFNIKASFGSGKVKKRPLLAFLKDENTISNGIYPLIIFEEKSNEFIVCKGISFDNKPNKKWKINTRDDIKFKNTKYKDGLRTNSYFRNSYSTNNMTDSTIEDIQKDLESIMNDYPN
ncbi:hypothetical protein [Sulfurimonas sp.]|uniref:hypothetical protein n=1 Tax=Sulfurimonas sp. TaxID=2022749 RepID=UPI0025F8CE77|nr:hypothetical protein [Sulfurimonas sp.]